MSENRKYFCKNIIVMKGHHTAKQNMRKLEREHTHKGDVMPTAKTIMDILLPQLQAT